MNYQGPGMYRHFKGGVYIVIGLASHTDDTEQLVLYLAVSYRIWARPLKQFNEFKSIDGHNVPRFVKMSEEEKV